MGGDYSPRSNSYQFNERIIRSCVDIQIFGDSVYELDEDFSGQFRGFQLGSGSFQMSITGITIQQTDTTVTIQDTDGMNVCATERN